MEYLGEAGPAPIRILVPFPSPVARLHRQPPVLQCSIALGLQLREIGEDASAKWDRLVCLGKQQESRLDHQGRGINSGQQGAATGPLPSARDCKYRLQGCGREGARNTDRGVGARGAFLPGWCHFGTSSFLAAAAAEVAAAGAMRWKRGRKEGQCKVLKAGRNPYSNGRRTFRGGAAVYRCETWLDHDVPAYPVTHHSPDQTYCIVAPREPPRPGSSRFKPVRASCLPQPITTGTYGRRPPYHPPPPHPPIHPSTHHRTSLRSMMQASRTARHGPTHSTSYRAVLPPSTDSPSTDLNIYGLPTQLASRPPRDQSAQALAFLVVHSAPLFIPQDPQLPLSTRPSICQTSHRGSLGRGQTHFSCLCPARRPARHRLSFRPSKIVENAANASSSPKAARPNTRQMGSQSPTALLAIVITINIRPSDIAPHQSAFPVSPNSPRGHFIRMNHMQWQCKHWPNQEHRKTLRKTNNTRHCRWTVQISRRPAPQPLLAIH
ncbi:hypothetical protein K456DRAFT_1763225 [Colletotrichum gloeosporioides 23]|nr:hypothetical protein K456DRAFT_1763225 [Colletotrichum gloeosporioides 23]